VFAACCFVVSLLLVCCLLFVVCCVYDVCFKHIHPVWYRAVRTKKALVYALRIASIALFSLVSCCLLIEMLIICFSATLFCVARDM